MREVQQTILVAFVLVILVIFSFLRDWRTTLIPVVVIPVSLIGAFFVMYVAGFSINVLTLLGMVLAIGLVVDDAIVVLENIYAKIEAGNDPVQAGIDGTREIFFAVIATTLALVSVLLPMLFIGGLTGRLFREFGVTLAGAVIISSFVALTLTPMLCSRLLKTPGPPPLALRGDRALLPASHRRLPRVASKALLARRWLAVPLIARLRRPDRGLLPPAAHGAGAARGPRRRSGSTPPAPRAPPSTTWTASSTSSTR